MALRRSSETLRHLAWFVGLWAAGVVVVGAVAAALRTILL